MRSVVSGVALVAALVFAASPAIAQDSAPLRDSLGSEPQPVPLPDPQTIAVPSLAFKEGPADAAGYDKYFYFVREGTDFATAYADISECDGYARGLAFRIGPTGYPGTLTDALGDAFWGGGQRREMRRLNLRTCMNFKGYRRFGLPRNIWVQFNFEEGNKAPTAEVRQRALMQQARIASGPMPQARELGR